MSLPELKPTIEKDFELLYAGAFSLYESGDYKKGAQVFTGLVLNAPFCAKYWKGLAACRQMLEEYEAALHAWALAALVEENDPMPHFHAAECYLSLKDNSEAIKALEKARGLLGPSREDLLLQQKIDLLRKTYDTN